MGLKGITSEDEAKGGARIWDCIGMVKGQQPQHKMTVC